MFFRFKIKGQLNQNTDNRNWQFTYNEDKMQKCELINKSDMVVSSSNCWAELYKNKADNHVTFKMTSLTMCAFSPCMPEGEVWKGVFNILHIGVHLGPATGRNLHSNVLINFFP